MKTVFAWIQAHTRQLATLALWAAVMIAARRWPAHLSDVELVASTIALAVGIQLPPFKFSAQSLTKIIGSALIMCAFAFAAFAFAACSPRVTAKDVYSLKSHACLDSYSTRAQQITCLDEVRAEYDEAGAPPAAIDGGVEGKSGDQ